MLNLIKNEWMKLWSKKGTWTMVILLAVIIVGVMGIVKYSEGAFDETAWNAELEIQLEEVETALAEPDIEADEKANLEAEQADLQEMIAMNIESSKPVTRESLIADTFGMMAIVTLLTIIVASGIVSTEFSEGTIKMLLSRPVKRWKILTSKYVTVLLFCLLATAITYVASFVSAFIFFPGATESTITFSNQEIATSAYFGKSLYLLFLAFINAAIISTLAFTLGVVFRSTAMAIGISVFLYFTGGIIVAFLQEYEIAKYIIFAHTNLTQFETGYLTFPDMTMPFSVAVLLVYWVLFLVISYMMFGKRDVTA